MSTLWLRELRVDSLTFGTKYRKNEKKREREEGKRVEDTGRQEKGKETPDGEGERKKDRKRETK